MIYNILRHNDKQLLRPTSKFDFNNSDITPLDLASNLAETMLYNNGIGLAANQCGLDYSVFVMLADELIPVFNPLIVDFSSEAIILEEGCLSCDSVLVKVKRPRRIKVRYTEPNGNVVTRVFDGITSRVFQHEYDHLQGIIHLDKTSFIHRERALKKLKHK